MNNLAVKDQSTELVQYDRQLISTLRNSLYPGAKEESVCMVVAYCHQANLDVMLKPVHIVPMWIVDKESGKGEMRDVIMPGINLYRTQASRSGCAGISEPEFGEDVTECLGGIDITYPKWCKITVKKIIRRDHIVEFTAKEYWKENYANAGKDKATGRMKLEPNAMWSKRPYGQLAKCAEAQALRKAFPEIGAMPTAEEMEGKHLDSQEFDDMQKQKFIPGKGVAGLKEKLGIAEPIVIDIDSEVVNEETGEVNENAPDIDTIKFLIEGATTIKQLVEAGEQAKFLPEEDRKVMRALYKDKEKQLNS